jgi:hypothetical protein
MIKYKKISVKKILVLCLLTIFLVGCNKNTQTHYNRNIKIDIKLPTTPIKNQGNSPLCWIYGMLATIETEHLVKGDSVNLSEDYLARMYLREQAMQRLYNKRNYRNKNIDLRGTMPMVIDLLQIYGLQHIDAYHKTNNTSYNVMAKRLSLLTKSSYNVTPKDIDNYLDKNIAFMPKKVFLYGAIYTPQEFANSVCTNDEYTAVTSFLHHPFMQRFPLEITDNKFHNTFLNVPLNKIITLIEHSIQQHHPVCWEGDVSEKGFNWQQGIADVNKNMLPITAEKRQKAFENYQTTDDHIMEIVGLAHDEKGKKYVLCKNSWGKSNFLNGFIFLSYDYIKLKTIAIMVKNNIK